MKISNHMKILFHAADTTKSDVLVDVFKDTMLRMNLSKSDCRGQCDDRTANTCESKNGVATQIRSLESCAIFIHCYGHALNSAIGNMIKGNKILRETLDNTYGISKLLQYSQK